MRGGQGFAGIGALAMALWTGPAAAAEPLRVLAAASLAEAFRDLAAAYEKARPGSRVELSLAGSQVMRTQIEQGAPADVFASAELEHAEALTRAGLLRGFRVFTRNRMAVVVPAAGARVARLQELAEPGVKLVVAGPSVPAGRYASQVLEKLAASGLFAAGFGARVRANFVSQETNVRVVLSKVALGEADAGFVYATDAASSDKVRTIEIPEACNVVAEYPIGVVGKSSAPGAAQAFIDLVLGAEGQAILVQHGFAR